MTTNVNKILFLLSFSLFQLNWIPILPWQKWSSTKFKCHEPPSPSTITHFLVFIPLHSSSALADLTCLRSYVSGEFFRFESPWKVPVVMEKERWGRQTTALFPLTRNVLRARSEKLPIVVSHSLSSAMPLIKQHRVACCRGGVVTLPVRQKTKSRCCLWLCTISTSCLL